MAELGVSIEAGPIPFLNLLEFCSTQIDTPTVGFTLYFMNLPDSILFDIEITNIDRFK
ncbi:MAG: hypothetical protein JSV09_01365 [Thermoplasmata archaeon]|nr:MAG: hypothetical protein JSV09_01365 [Thermoplasmata archaeon]